MQSVGAERPNRNYRTNAPTDMKSRRVPREPAGSSGERPGGDGLRACSSNAASRHGFADWRRIERTRTPPSVRSPREKMSCRGLLASWALARPESALRYADPTATKRALTPRLTTVVGRG